MRILLHLLSAEFLTRTILFIIPAGKIYGGQGKPTRLCRWNRMLTPIILQAEVWLNFVLLTAGAGGTAFDLKRLQDFNELTIDPNSGRRWIQYIKIECLDTDPEGLLPEVDAVSDVTCCGDYKHPFPVGDINRDCCTDSADLEILCRNWLIDVDRLKGEYLADLYQDNEKIINFKDLSVLAAHWLEKTWP